MRDLVSYTLRLVIAAVVVVVVFLLLGAALLLLIGAIETTGKLAAPELSLAIAGLSAFATALAVSRFIWLRWLRPRDRKLEYWRRVVEEAGTGSHWSGNTAAPGASVQLTEDGLALNEPSQREEVKWSEVREIRVRTFRKRLAGPLFVIVKNDGKTVSVPQEEIPPSVLARMQQLPAFRNEALIEAMGSMDDAEFSCWRQGEPPR